MSYLQVKHTSKKKKKKMAELSSYLKLVQVPQTSADQYHKSTFSFVSNFTRPCFCVHVCVSVCVCVSVLFGTSYTAQSIGHPRCT